MPVTSSDFFISGLKPDPWGGPTDTTTQTLDRERLTALVAGPDSVHADVDVSLALMDLVRDDLLLSGTSADHSLSDQDMRLAVQALARVTHRAGLEVKLPFRDHSGWKTWWNRNGAHGSWQARRDLLSDLFDDPYAALMAAQERALDASLLSAVSPHARVGWPEVDTEIGEMRKHFRTATTPQDYRAVGNDCVHVAEALSRKVYRHDIHTPAGEAEPPVQKTKLRLERYVEGRLPGTGNAELRKFARATIELAQGVKHSGTPTRAEAGIAADAVITLANMLRRLDEGLT